MAKKVVQLHHGLDIAQIHFKNYNGLLMIVAFLSILFGFFLLSTMEKYSESLFMILISSIAICPFFFVLLSVFSFKFFVEFNDIEYTSEELILVSPSNRISPTRYEYHIHFDKINEISFNYWSSYAIKYDKESIDKLPPPLNKQANYSIGYYWIPPRLIKDQAKEKKLWEAFDSLNKYYKERGKDYVVYNPPTMHYQRKFGANKQRNKNHDGVIFLVKKYKGE